MFLKKVVDCSVEEIEDCLHGRYKTNLKKSELKNCFKWIKNNKKFFYKSYFSHQGYITNLHLDSKDLKSALDLFYVFRDRTDSNISDYTIIIHEYISCRNDNSYYDVLFYKNDELICTKRLEPKYDSSGRIIKNQEEVYKRMSIKLTPIQFVALIDCKYLYE